MSTRIRYSKPVEGVITSTQFYTNENGTRYQVQIRINSDKERHFPWLVIEDPAHELHGEGVAVNLHKAKIKAKKKLEELGVSFEKESREEKPVATVQPE